MKQPRKWRTRLGNLGTAIFPDPKVRDGRDVALIERRNLISSAFIAVLISLAYQEMIVPVRESLQASGPTLGNVLLPLMFFLTSMRFFIGNQLHLLSKKLVEMRGDVWFYDFMVITFQTVVLCFLGSVSTVDASKSSKITYVDFLIILNVTDSIWIVSQWVLGKLFESWRRKGIPWAWAILNGLLVLVIYLLSLVIPDFYSDTGLVALGVLSAGAFFVDLLLIDQYVVI